jgi:uncharacterized membrane protein YecN with MAPEG domain
MTDPFLICAAVLVVLLMVLSINVTRLRSATKIGIGPAADPTAPLSKAVRAQGNASEYVPLFVALFLFFHATGVPLWVMWVAIAATAARVIHPIGLMMTRSFDRSPHPLRVLGAAGTYLGGLVFGAALVLEAFHISR